MKRKVETIAAAPRREAMPFGLHGNQRRKNKKKRTSLIAHTFERTVLDAPVTEVKKHERA
ncbi:MAG TPA: hypothetical protein VLR92_11470 [Blastocatellia bacterium]|nr:hypothetical protein [Blastocatellia bacterium]